MSGKTLNNLSSIMTAGAPGARRTLRVASCMAPSADAMCRALARYLAQKLDRPVELVEGVAWTERERMLDAGAIDLCWICGLPYVEKADRGDPIGLCVAPVMRGERYGGSPVYYTDLIRDELTQAGLTRSRSKP